MISVELDQATKMGNGRAQGAFVLQLVGCIVLAFLLTAGARMIAGFASHALGG